MPEGEAFNKRGDAARAKDLSGHRNYRATHPVKPWEIPNGAEIAKARFARAAGEKPADSAQEAAKPHGGAQRKLDASAIECALEVSQRHRWEAVARQQYTLRR